MVLSSVSRSVSRSSPQGRPLPPKSVGFTDLEIRPQLGLEPLTQLPDRAFGHCMPIVRQALAELLGVSILPSPLRPGGENPVGQLRLLLESPACLCCGCRRALQVGARSNHGPPAGVRRALESGAGQRGTFRARMRGTRIVTKQIINFD